MKKIKGEKSLKYLVEARAFSAVNFKNEIAAKRRKTRKIKNLTKKFFKMMQVKHDNLKFEVSPDNSKMEFRQLYNCWSEPRLNKSTNIDLTGRADTLTLGASHFKLKEYLE